MAESYYDLLGVRPEAASEDIEQAYREKLKETHPDVSSAEDASERTKRLIEARDVLTNEDERAAYDRLGHEAYVQAAENRFANPSEEERADVSGAGRTSTAGTGRTASESSSPGHSGAGTGPGATGATGCAGASSTAGSDTRGTARRRAETRTSGPSDPAETEGPGGWWAENLGDVDGSDPVGDMDWQETERASQGSRAGMDDRGGDGEWHAWNTDAPYSIGGDRGSGFIRLDSLRSSQNLFILSITFPLYPVLLWLALVRAFPLYFNVLVAVSALILMVFLQSIPTIGLLVFGSWLVLLPLLLVGVFGIGLSSWYGGGMVLGTAFPFGLSVLTRLVLRG